MSKELSVTVERGTKQIGGCCTLIKYGNSCIAIDIGSELPGKTEKNLYIPELMEKSAVNSCEALFLTHYHGDHIGEISKVASNIKIYASETTKQVMNLYQNHMGTHSSFHVDIDRIRGMEYDRTVKVGDFLVTAIASDHSAIGAVMYLIEVGGKRILHTGDFRMHGNREIPLLHKKEIGNIDLLITEGTTLTRREGKEPWNEERVKQELERIYKKYKYVFVLVSSTNLDRLQIISEQVKRGRYFVVTEFQIQLMKLAEELDECTFNKPLYYSTSLDEKMEKRGFVMVVGYNTVSENLMKKYFDRYPQESCLIYSMWSGYLECENIKKIADIAGDKMFYAHSSGHVTVDDLNEFIDKINPDKIIVIHTESTEKENINMRDRLICAKDGEEILVN